MKIIVEYSRSQNAFHITDEEERGRYETARKSDYEVVEKFDNWEEADKFISNNYDNIKQFGYFKNLAGELFIL